MSEDNEITKTTSTSSQSSFTSMGMGPSLAAESSSRLTPEGGAPPGETIYDTMAFLIYCSNHEKIALSKADRAVWMPFVMIHPSKTYDMLADEGISIVLSKGHKELDAILEKKPPVKENICAQITRIQLPNEKFITQLTRIVRLEVIKGDDYQCCQNTKRLQWMPMKDVVNGNIEKIWGPEVSQFAQLIGKEGVFSIQEFRLEDVFDYIDNESDNDSEQKMLKSLKIERKDLEKLYVNFIEHCFPSFFMSIDSFKDFMTDYGYDRNDSRLIRMFNAFSIQGKEFLSFRDFLLGLAAMEPNSLHEVFRIEFIFRFYDLDRDQNLTEDDIKIMLRDMVAKVEDRVLKDKAKDVIKEFASKDDKISCDDFLKAVNLGELQGTKYLCRFSKPLLAEVSKSMTEKSKQKRLAKSTALVVLKTSKNRKNRGICSGCRAQNFDYGLHSVRLDTTGRCAEPRRIIEHESLRQDVMTRQRYSMEYKFNSKSIANVFLDLIREFNEKKSKEKGFLCEDKEFLIKYLNNLCSDTRSLFSHEERVMKLNSPVVVIGDIRANLNDLFSLERCLWNSFPIVSANFLFLGNFVEFGENGIESIIYLLSLKIISPNKIFLLRGCHEVKKQHKFHKECLNKYGKQIGSKVWELINSVFAELPIASIIDENIFCANGGIPHHSKVDDINTFAADLKRPEKYSNIMKEILNNEPISSQKEVQEFSDGFAPNESRDAFWFNKEAIDKFLESNGLSHIFRSNNLYNNNGYAFHFENKCLTIFSNSKENNELSTVLVDSNLIRIISIDSQNTDKNTNSNTI